MPIASLKHRFLAAVLLASAAAPGAVAAQISEIPLGTRVRVTSGTGKRVVGVLLTRTDSAWRVGRDVEVGQTESETGVMLSEIRAVDRSTGHATYTLVGAAIGLGAGVAIGQIANRPKPVTCHSSQADPFCVGQGSVAAVGHGFATVGIAVAGLLLGAVIGSGIATDTWEAVALTERPSQPPRISPQINRQGLGLSITF